MILTKIIQLIKYVNESVDYVTYMKRNIKVSLIEDISKHRNN